MIVLSVLLSATISADGLPAMKEVNYRQGLIAFAIPFAWREEYEPSGGGTFYLDEPDSGTLRLNVLTFRKSHSAALLSSTEVLSGMRTEHGAAVRELANGNAIREYVVRTEEEGEAITLFWWELANVVPPDHVRIATFSYTVLSSQEGSASLAKELELLRSSIEKARFAKDLGL